MASGYGKAKAPPTAAAAGYTGSDWYGSSAEFYGWLRSNRPWLVVDERSVCMIEGPPGWHSRPFARPPSPESCPWHRGPVRPGSVMFCPLCGSSGSEGRLAAQREAAGLPPPSPAPYRPGAGTAGRVKGAARRAAGAVKSAAAAGRRAALKGGLGGSVAEG